MEMPSDAKVESWYVSTGHLPSPAQIQRWVDEAHARYRPVSGGENAQVYPALARVPSDLFGICAVGTSGNVYVAGDAAYEFAIMSAAKPFVFALICQSLGPEEARKKLGVNATGLPFNSFAAVERSEDGRTNPMVNAGAIATVSLIPGDTAEARWRFIHDGLSRFAGRSLALNDEVYIRLGDEPPKPRLGQSPRELRPHLRRPDRRIGPLHQALLPRCHRDRFGHTGGNRC